MVKTVQRKQQKTNADTSGPTGGVLLCSHLQWAHLFPNCWVCALQSAAECSLHPVEHLVAKLIVFALQGDGVVQQSQEVLVPQRLEAHRDGVHAVQLRRPERQAVGQREVTYPGQLSSQQAG